MQASSDACSVLVITIRDANKDSEERTDNDWISASVIATMQIWADALGIYGEFGRIDYYDEETLNSTINPYPNLGPEETGGNEESEQSWGSVHEAVGHGLGMIGVDPAHARKLMEVWEITEPGIWTGWGAWGEYRGRGRFEGGRSGAQSDIDRGMEGYEAGRAQLKYILEVIRYGRR
jgi:hypothetical protein